MMPILEMNILPPQAKHLGATQTESKREVNESFERIALNDREEPPKVLHARHFVGPALLPRRMSLLSDVSRQMVALDRYIQRRSKPDERGATRFGARADLLQFVLPPLNVFGLKLGEAHLAQVRLDVPTDEDFI